MDRTKIALFVNNFIELLGEIVPAEDRGFIFHLRDTSMSHDVSVDDLVWLLEQQKGHVAGDGAYRKQCIIKTALDLIEEFKNGE